MTSPKPSDRIPSFFATISLFTTVSILGCGGARSLPVTMTVSAHNGIRLRGHLKAHPLSGGPQPTMQQPISGATIQLYQVGTAGDGSIAQTLGSSTTTDASGGFTLTGDYMCPGSNPLVYLLASGGNPGFASGTNNTAIELIAALGPCDSLSATTSINLNEVTTVAAVAALAPYMTSPTAIGSGTGDASGLTAAFTLASQLASTTTGASPGTSVPAGDAVPSTMINSLAGIVSSCVNTTGGVAGDGSNCGTLFTDATPPSGTAPTDVATALLDILNNPTSNLTSLFGLMPSTPPFEPVYNAPPSSAAISLITTPAGGALVDYGTSEQVIRGFGASEVFFGVLPHSQFDELYGQGSGQVGLSIMRVQIAPATWNTTTQTADTTQWTAELTNAQYAQQTYGATVFATPWTPPASMKTSSASQPYNTSCSSGTDLCGGYLNPTSYADYANYLEAFVNYAENTMGVNLYAVSIQNEPDFNATYVSCLWTGAQFDAWITGTNTTGTVNASVLTTGANPVKLMMPESDQFNTTESDPSLNDANAVGYISIVGGHLYGASPFYYTNAENKGKDVWMTEHFIVPVTGTNTTTMPDALAIAEEIHNSMTVADYNAYVWWEGPNTNPNITPQEHLITSSAVPTYFGLGMTQFSRFIRPGYYRYNATATPVSGVYLSAYSGGGHEVVVAINSTSSAVTLPIQFANQTVASVTPYQTTSTASVSQLSAVTVTNNEFSATLPAQSITTYVQ